MMNTKRSNIPAKHNFSEVNKPTYKSIKCALFITYSSVISFSPSRFQSQSSTMKYLTVVTSFPLFSITAFAQSSLSTAGSPSPSLLVTTNGQCGAIVGMTCLGNPSPGGGQCCSSSGWW
jgi:hypothetical protein